MDAYRVPFENTESEFVEKRSRFISHIWRVETEAEARAHIEEMKKKYYDARHNCWCYLLKEGNAVRYSDDGEPQGTAGQPMLNVFQREEVTNVCCVVTRYFGGVLLGAGGLTRAYTKGAKDALDAAGISTMEWDKRHSGTGSGCSDWVRQRVNTCSPSRARAGERASPTARTKPPRSSGSMV